MNTNLMLVGIIKGDRGNSYIIIDKHSQKTVTMSGDEFQSAVKNKQIENAVAVQKGFECTTSSINSLPLYAMNGALLKNSGLTVLQVKKSKYSQTHYALMDCNFRVQVVNEADALNLIKQFSSINAKIVTKNGKQFISAKKGNFDTVEFKTNPNGDKKTKSADRIEIKYLGNTLKMSEPARLFRLSKLNKARVEKAKMGAEPDRYAFDDEHRVEKYLAKVIRTYIAGNVGKRYKYHYEHTLKALKEIGISKAQDVLELINALKQAGRGNGGYWHRAKVGSTVAKPFGDDVISCYFKLKSEMYIDYLSYGRDALMQHNLKDLVMVIYNNPAAMEYIEKNVKVKGQEALAKSIRKAAKGKIDTINSVMFISALSLAQYKKSFSYWMQHRGSTPIKLVNKRKAEFKNRCSWIISGVSGLVNEEVVKITNENELGAMIFQATVIAMEKDIKGW